VNAPQPMTLDSGVDTEMLAALQKQRDSYLQEGAVDAGTRIDRINRAIDVLIRHADAISEALNTDFTCRPRQVNLLSDVASSVGTLKHARKHLKGWMKAEKRPTIFPLNLLGGRSRIEYQPKGVVGIVAPWNFPVAMVFQPMAGILAAGNRVMIKPSEFTPATSDVIASMIAEAFDATEAAVFTGGPEVGQAFAGLPFDHMIFTGATGIARHIMAAASRNLVPLTLELGGKSPVVISRSANLELTMQRIMLGKTLNAGQICLAPDYLLVPEEQLEQVVAAAKSAVEGMYPTLLQNPEYTSVVNARHYQRLSGYLEEANIRGQRIVALNPGNEDFESQSGSFKIPPTLIVKPEDDLALMQEEIFGPLLPILTYQSFDETIDYINRRPRPLAAYYFGSDNAEEEALIKRTTSGGVCVNDVLMHIVQEDLPFGGIGPSGMGSYHGLEGFRTFSHAKSVYRQTSINVAKLGGMLPPYSSKTENTIKAQLKR